MVFLIIAVLSVVICALVSLIVISTLGWKNDWRYWLLTCGALPIGLVAIGLLLLLTFEPPQTTYGDALLNPDPGPLNFAIATFIGGIAPMIYVVVAIPTAFIVKKLLRP